MNNDTNFDSITRLDEPTYLDDEILTSPLPKKKKVFFYF